MKQSQTLDGHDWQEMFTAGIAWLEQIVPNINALNVYPVPDGDCGTNMMFTMRSSLTEADGLRDAGVAAVAEALARGALMGARGNSGVILSQIYRGLTRALQDKDVINAADLAAALREAATTAYQALSNPVEGTILTVIRSAAEAAERAAAETGATPVSVMEAAQDAAREAVLETPNLLDVLRDAGVVDAGGHGLFTFLEGALLYLKGDADHRTPELLSSGIVLSESPAMSQEEEEPYGFCTQFMLNGSGMDVARVRDTLEPMGQSAIVVGDASVIRVHIHTPEPQTVITRASAFGEVVDVDINNMDEQHEQFMVMQQARSGTLPAAVIAVANGDGLVKVFSEFGVTAIIRGGQTMNPSTMDFLEAIQKVPSDNIIILPNNKNVIPTARLVETLSEKNLRVVPTETITQGIAALIAFVPESEFEENIAIMTEAIAAVTTIEVTRATRATSVSGLSVKAGNVIGLLNGKLLAAADNCQAVTMDLLERIDLTEAGIVTLYYGVDTAATEAEALGNVIAEKYPDLEVGIVNGGQPHYDYLISVE